MKVSQRSFPHPVVGNSDDVFAEFQCEMDDPTLVNGYHEIELGIKTNSETLLQRLKAKDAIHQVHVECSKTLYRESFDFRGVSHAIKIPADALDSTVEINVFVTACRDIADYRVEGSHSDYGKGTFAIRKGDILAVSGGHSFHADVEFESLRKVSSIIVINSNKTPDGPMTVDLGDEKIVILIPQPDYVGLHRLRNTSPGLFEMVLPGLVIPALVYALCAMQQDEHGDDLRWHSIIRSRAEREEIDLEEPLEAAQQLLGLPVTRAIVAGVGWLDNESEE